MPIQIDIQQGIYDVLSAGLSYPVFDDVPQDFEGFPYVTIGDTTFGEFSSDIKSGFDITATIHVWSRYAGSKEAKEIQGEIYTLLHRQNLPLTGDYGISGITFDFSQVMLDPDGLTRHGVIRFDMHASEV